jgi:hypothetical protein
MWQTMEKEGDERWQRYRSTIGEDDWFAKRKGKVKQSFSQKPFPRMSRDISSVSSRTQTRVVDDEYVVIDMADSQVQPDVEELLPNMEDNEDVGSRRSEDMHLGKLEYSLDYDFQKQEVRWRLLNAQGQVYRFVCLAQSGSDSSATIASDGPERHLRSVCESLCATR